MTGLKHIVAIPSWYRDGRGSGGGYFRDQALALQAAGHRVALLAPEIYTLRDVRSGRAGADGAGRVSREQDGVPVYRQSRRMVMPRLPYRNAVAWSGCGLDLFAAYVAEQGRPDLVHAHSCLNAGVLAARIKSRYSVPFVVTEHSTGFAQNRLRRWERGLIRRVLARADVCIAVSPHLARLLEAQFPGTAWYYVPNILGEAFLAPAPADAPERADRPFAFLCAARLSPEKNHALLIEAFADAFAGDPGARLLLAGAGVAEAGLRALCTERGVAAQVAFLGTLPPQELRRRMAAADAFVLASDVETFGVAVIEAQAAGLPAVVTASGGPDHLIDRTNGSLVPVGDRAALRDALRKMRRDAAGYDRARISADAVTRFGPAAFARRFAEVAL